MFILAASDDTIGINIQFNDLITKLNSVGVSETISSIPQLGHYKQWVVPVVGAVGLASARSCLAIFAQ